MNKQDQLQKMEDVKTVIEARVRMSKELIERMGVTMEQFERVALNALIANPALVDCTRESLELATLRCAEVGLMPDGTVAAIIPYKDQAVFQVMVKGKLVLARRATKGLWVHSECVYEGDDFNYASGTKPVLHHKPTQTAVRTDDCIVAVYAIAEVPGAVRMEFEWLWKSQIDVYKARSRSGKKGGHSPWATDYAEMAEKTALGLLLKRLPARPGEEDDYQEEDPLAGIVSAEDAAQSPEDVRALQETGEKPKAKRGRGRPRKEQEAKPETDAPPPPPYNENPPRPDSPPAPEPPPTSAQEEQGNEAGAEDMF